MSKLLAMAALATMIATNALAYGGGGFGHTTGAGVAHNVAGGVAGRADR